MLLTIILGCFDTIDKEALEDTSSETNPDEQASCSADEQEDCNDECAPVAWLGDGECDPGFNCDEFNHDEGDCDDVPNDTSDDWGEASCDDAIDFGSAGNFTAENIQLTWSYDPGLDDVVAGPYYFNFPPDLEGVSFTLDAGANYAQPYYFGTEDGTDVIVDIESDINAIRSGWDNTNTVVLPMSPQTAPPEGCVGVLFWGADENNDYIPEGTSSTLHINSRRFSTGNAYVINFVVVNESTVSETQLNSIWETTASHFDTLGIDVSQTYFDTIETGAGSYIYADSTEAHQIFATPPTNQGDNRELNVYFVDALLDDDGTMGLYGYAGGVPGPLGVLETKNSGVIVSLDIHRFGDGSFDYTEFGATIAHELGHQLGLFHTTESDGSENDILSDTPSCDLSDDLNGDDVLDPSECEDGDHVMFWTTPGGAFPQETWSSQQADVLRSSPMIFQQ